MFICCLYGSQGTENICITFIQRRPNVFDAGSTLYKWTNLCTTEPTPNKLKMSKVCQVKDIMHSLYLKITGCPNYTQHATWWRGKKQHMWNRRFDLCTTGPTYISISSIGLTVLVISPKLKKAARILLETFQSWIYRRFSEYIMESLLYFSKKKC